MINCTKCGKLRLAKIINDPDDVSDLNKKYLIIAYHG